MERELTLESEEWYVLTNWLRERENRLQYALRSKSEEWEFVHDLRQEIERQRKAEAEASAEADARAEASAETASGNEATPDTEITPETRGTTRTVSLSDRQVTYLSSFLRRRARKLLFLPWRDRERRDVRHLRDHLLEEAESGPATRTKAGAGAGK